MLSNPPQTNEVHVLRWDTCGEDVFRRSPEAPFQIERVWSMKLDETLQDTVQHVSKQTTKDVVKDHEQKVSSLKVEETRQDTVQHVPKNPTEEVVKDHVQKVGPDLTPPLHRDEETSYICNDCGKCFIGYSRFVLHRKRHHGKYIECEQCKLTFRHETYLTRHLACHRILTPFRCTECKLCFGKNSDLLLHQRVHRGEKPYQCLDCEQCFAQVSDLAVHEMIHDDETTETDKKVPCQPTFQKWQKGLGMRQHYQCAICVRSYSNLSHLRRHEKSHKAQKPIESPKCKETFCLDKELTEHEKTHTKQKGYACSDCGATFRLQAHVASHQRMHTRTCK